MTDQAANPAPAPTLHQTTVVTTDPVQLIVGEQSSAFWHKVLDALWDEGVMARLPDPAFRVLGAFLRLRRDERGIVAATVQRLEVMTGRKRSYVYQGRAFLLDHPRSLLAERIDLGRDSYHVLPGWRFAARPLGFNPAQSAGADDPVRHRGKLSAMADENPQPRTHCAPVGSDQPNQEVKKEEKTPDQDQGACEAAAASACGLVGPEKTCSATPQDLFAAARRRDLEAALTKAGVRGEARRLLANREDLEAQEVYAVWMEAKTDTAVVDPKSVTAYRLLDRRGLKLPESKRTPMAPAVLSSLRGIQQMRDNRVESSLRAQQRRDP